MIGKKLGQYEITGKIGEGGMGEVFLAVDTRLGRDAALKFLQPALAADPERMARFRNEAKVLAALNHPNIAAIHGLEESDGFSFLAMEYVEGADLSDRIDSSPLPLDEALEMARQLADGLEAAHESGIIHRDLKPANLRITPEGQLKILDFGLARNNDGLKSTDSMDSPTMTQAFTQEGMILGTAAYMSPEQARGRKVDHRTDIWSFGAILYEMLTGQRLFSGETASDNIAAVLRKELDFAQLPPETPESVRRLLRRCLERDTRRRLRDIGEARVRLERWRDDPASIHETSLLTSEYGRSQPWAVIVPWLVTALSICIALGSFWWTSQRPPVPPAHTEWILEEPAEEEIPSIRLNVLFSPDGQWCGWVTPEGIRIRNVESSEVTLLPETSNTQAACFSPDSRWLAFVVSGGIYRVSVGGGSPFRLCDSPLTRGIVWVDDNTLVFTDGIATGLTALNLATGEARAITTPDTTRNERSHRWPSVVPGRRGVLFECQFLGRDYDSSDIDFVDLDTGQRHNLMKGGASPHARSSGHLLFARRDVIFAVKLDLERLEIDGLPLAVREGVVTRIGNQEDDDGSSQFALDGMGNLLYMDTMGSQDELSQLAWINFSDGTISPVSEMGRYGEGTISPDGQDIAVLIQRGGDVNIYVRNLVSGSEQMLTSRPRVEYLGSWSPDSRTLYWTQDSDSGDRFEVWSRPANGSVPASFVASPPSIAGSWVTGISPDGGLLGVACFKGVDQFDIMTVDLTTNPPQSSLLIGGPQSQKGMGFDNTGGYFFYIQDTLFFREDEAEGGNLLLRRYPDTGAVWSMPNPGGKLDVWKGSKELGGIIAVHEDGVYLLPVDLTADAPVIGTPRLLMDLKSHAKAHLIRNWYLTGNGDRALINLAEDQGDDKTEPSLVLVTGWDDVVARKLEGGGNSN